MPTTDKRDEYEESKKRREDLDRQRAERIWAFVFNLIVILAAGAVVAIIIALLNR